MVDSVGRGDVAGEQIWFSEINEPIARAIAHHWPDAPNLADITTIEWNGGPPVTILSDSFPG